MRVGSGPVVGIEQRGRAVFLAITAMAITAALGITATGAAPPSAAAMNASPTQSRSSTATTSSPGTTNSPVTTTTTSVPTGTVASAGFEDGTTLGFTATPPATLTNTTSAAHTGTHSLLVQGMTGYSQGAVFGVSPQLLPAGYYGVSAWVRLSAGGVQDLDVVPVDAPGATVLQSKITRLQGTDWAQIVTYLRWSAPPTGLQVRFQPVANCADAPAVPLPFLVDDIAVSFYGTVPPPLPLFLAPPCPLGSTSTSTTSTPVTTTTPITTTTPVTTTTPTPTCRVVYAVSSQWAGGFQGSISLQNLGVAAWNGWVLQWAFPSGQQLTQLWGGGSVTQNGALVTVPNAAWNATVPPAGVVTLGLTATWTTINAMPLAFTVNGQPCQVVLPV